MCSKVSYFFILDANIIIDYVLSDRTLLKLISAHVGTIYLATPVLEEIKELDESECDRLGIQIVEPETEILMKSAAVRGALSFQDHLSLLLAKEQQWTCVTNDKPLRRACEQENVSTLWGIELICILVEAKGLDAASASEIILTIHRNNPKYITKPIVERAFIRLGIHFK